MEAKWRGKKTLWVDWAVCVCACFFFWGGDFFFPTSPDVPPTYLLGNCSELLDSYLPALCHTTKQKQQVDELLLECHVTMGQFELQWDQMLFSKVPPSPVTVWVSKAPQGNWEGKELGKDFLQSWKWTTSFTGYSYIIHELSSKNLIRTFPTQPNPSKSPQVETEVAMIMGCQWLQMYHKTWKGLSLIIKENTQGERIYLGKTNAYLENIDIKIINIAYKMQK